MAGIDLNTYKKTSTTSKKEPKKANGLMELLNKDISLGGNKVKDKKKEGLYMELGTLLSSGVDIRAALELIASGLTKKNDIKIVDQLSKDVISGDSLSQAMKNNKSFTPYEVFGVQIGEETGKLSSALEELATYFHKKVKQRMQLVSALTYPVIVLGFAFLAVGFLLKFIVPMFADIFKRFGGELPPITQFIIDVSNSFSDYFSVFLLVLVGIIVTTRLLKKKTWYRKANSSLSLRIPVVGGMMKKVYLARFSQAMALLIGSRVPILQAIGLVKQMITFYPIQSSLVQVEKEIMNGVSLHQALEHHKFYDKKLISLVKVGEEVNKLDEFFDKLAKQYSDEVDHRSATLSSLLEPFLIIFLGLLVAVILISMYLPLFNLSNQLN